MPAPDSGKRKKMGVQSQVQQQSILEEVAQFQVTPQKAPTITGGFQYQGEAYRANISNTWQGVNELFQSGVKSAAQGKQIYDHLKAVGAEDERLGIRNELNKMQEDGASQQEQWTWLEKQETKYPNLNKAWMGDLRVQTQGKSYAAQASEDILDYNEKALTMSPEKAAQTARDMRNGLPENQQYLLDNLVSSAERNHQTFVQGTAAHAILTDIGQELDHATSDHDRMTEFIHQLGAPYEVMGPDGEPTGEMATLFMDEDGHYDNAYQAARAGQQSNPLFGRFVREQIKERLAGQNPGMDATHIEQVTQSMESTLYKRLDTWRAEEMRLEAAKAERMGTHVSETGLGHDSTGTQSALTTIAQATGAAVDSEASREMATKQIDLAWQQTMKKASRNDWASMAEDIAWTKEKNQVAEAAGDIGSFFLGAEGGERIQKVIADWELNPDNPNDRMLIAKQYREHHMQLMLERANGGNDPAARQFMLSYGAELEDPSDLNSNIVLGEEYIIKEQHAAMRLMPVIAVDAMEEIQTDLQRGQMTLNRELIVTSLARLGNVDLWDAAINQIEDPDQQKQARDFLMQLNSSGAGEKGFMASLMDDLGTDPFVTDTLPSLVAAGVDVEAIGQQFDRSMNVVRDQINTSTISPMAKSNLNKLLDQSIGGPMIEFVKDRAAALRSTAGSGLSATSDSDEARKHFEAGTGGLSPTVAVVGGHSKNDAATQASVDHSEFSRAMGRDLQELSGYFPAGELSEEAQSMAYANARNLYPSLKTEAEKMQAYGRDLQIINEWRNNPQKYTYQDVVQGLTPALRENLFFDMVPVNPEDGPTGEHMAVINPAISVMEMSPFRAMSLAATLVEGVSELPGQTDILPQHREKTAQYLKDQIVSTTNALAQLFVGGIQPSEGQSAQAIIGFLATLHGSVEDFPEVGSILRDAYHANKDNPAMNALELLLPVLTSQATARDLSAMDWDTLSTQLHNGELGFLNLYNLAQSEQGIPHDIRALASLNNPSAGPMWKAISNMRALTPDGGFGQSSLGPRSLEGDELEEWWGGMPFNDEHYSGELHGYNPDGTYSTHQIGAQNPLAIFSQVLSGTGMNLPEDMMFTMTYDDNHGFDESPLYDGTYVSSSGNQGRWTTARAYQSGRDIGSDYEGQAIKPSVFVDQILAADNRFYIPAFEGRVGVGKEFKNYVEAARSEEGGAWTNEAIMSHYMVNILMPNEARASAFAQATALVTWINRTRGNDSSNPFRGGIPGIKNFLNLVDNIEDRNGWDFSYTQWTGREGDKSHYAASFPDVPQSRAMHGSDPKGWSPSGAEYRPYGSINITPTQYFNVKIDHVGHGVSPGDQNYMVTGRRVFHEKDISGDPSYYRAHSSEAPAATGEVDKYGQGGVVGPPLTIDRVYAGAQVYVPYVPDPRTPGVIADPLLTMASDEDEAQFMRDMGDLYGQAVIDYRAGQTQYADYGERIDGTPKGPGWHGEIGLPDGRTMTELSFDFEDRLEDGTVKKYFGPMIVPDTTAEEIEMLKRGESDDTIVEKAKAWARSRDAEGKSAFKERDAMEGSVALERLINRVETVVDPDFLEEEYGGARAFIEERLMLPEATGWNRDDVPTIAMIMGFNRFMVDLDGGWGDESLNLAWQTRIQDGSFDYGKDMSIRYVMEEMAGMYGGRNKNKGAPVLEIRMRSGERDVAWETFSSLRGNTNMMDTDFHQLSLDPSYRGNTLSDRRKVDVQTDVKTRTDTGQQTTRTATEQGEL